MNDTEGSTIIATSVHEFNQFRMPLVHLVVHLALHLRFSIEIAPKPFKDCHNGLMHSICFQYHFVVALRYSRSLSCCLDLRSAFGWHQVF